jgi:hypothetical protein
MEQFAPTVQIYLKYLRPPNIIVNICNQAQKKPTLGHKSILFVGILHQFLHAHEFNLGG